MSERVRNITYAFSAILLVLALAGLLIMGLKWMVWPLLVGAIGYTVAHIAQLRASSEVPMREKRLIRMAIAAGLFWIAASSCFIAEIDVWGILLIMAVLFMAYSNLMLALLQQKR